MIYFDSQQQIHEKDEIEELTGKLSFQKIENKLMHSVMENDKETIERMNFDYKKNQFGV